MLSDHSIEVLVLSCCNTEGLILLVWCTGILILSHQNAEAFILSDRSI